MANNNKSVKTPAKPAPAPVSRVQRSLMYMAGSVLGFGIAAVIAILIGDGVAQHDVQYSVGLWAVVEFVPLIAIPLGFALMIALLIITFVKRSRAAVGAGK